MRVGHVSRGAPLCCWTRCTRSSSQCRRRCRSPLPAVVGTRTNRQRTGQQEAGSNEASWITPPLCDRDIGTASAVTAPESSAHAGDGAGHKRKGNGLAHSHTGADTSGGDGGGRHRGQELTGASGGGGLKRGHRKRRAWRHPSVLGHGQCGRERAWCCISLCARVTGG